MNTYPSVDDGQSDDRFSVLLMTCMMTMATVCIAVAEWEEMLFYGSAPILSWFGLFRAIVLIELVYLCVVGWRAVWREGLLLGDLDNLKELFAQRSLVRATWHHSLFFFTMLLFLAVRCVLWTERGQRLPLLYHLLAPFVAVRWPASPSVPTVTALYVGTMISMWIILLWSNSFMLVEQFLDLLIMVLPVHIMLLLILIILRISNSVRNEALSRQEHQADILETFLTQLPCIIWATDNRAVFQWISGPRERRDMIVGKNITQLTTSEFIIDPVIVNEVHANHLKVVEQGIELQYMFEANLHGKKREHSVTLHPLRSRRDGRIIGVIGVAYDVSELMETERRLRRSKEEYSKLVSCISDTIISLDRHLRIRFINTDCFLGREKQDLLRHSILDFFNGYSGEIEVILRAVMSTGEERVTSWLYDKVSHRCFTENQMNSAELQCKILDGTVSSFMCSVNRSVCETEIEFGVGNESPSDQEQEGKTQLILSVRDMTENRRAAEQRRLAEEVLIVSRSKGEFIRQLSHEIRNPLTCICGSLELFESSADNLTRIQREYIKDSRAAALFLMDIMNDVLDTEKLNEGKIVLQETPNCLIDVVENIVTMQASNAAQRDLETICYVDPKIPSVLRFDRTRVSQILSNLISNAIKFTNLGHVYISVHLLEQDDTTATVVLRCEDTGVGVQEKNIEKIFQPFMQFPGDQRPTEFKGFGLGLNIVHNLTEIMGGKIDIQSKLGTGSTFSVHLPLNKVVPSTEMRESETTQILSISRIIIKSLFDTIAVVCRNKVLFDVLQHYLQEMQVVHVCFVEVIECNSDIVHEQVASVRRAVQRRQQERRSNGKIAVILDSSLGDIILDVADALHDQLDYKCVLLLHQGSAFEYSSRSGRHSIVKKPLRLLKLMQALCCTDDSNDVYCRSTTERFDQLVTQRMIPTALSRCDSYIMIVEDNPIVAKIHVKYLNRFGCNKVILAENGRAAINKVHESAPYEIVCILMDLQMPVMDGFAATERIRSMEDPSKSSIPIIAVTASGDQKTLDQCRMAGFDDLVQKPCTAKEMGSVLARVLKKKERWNEQ